MNDYDVFVSYNHKSKNHVDGLYSVLTFQYGLKVWIDFKNIRIGDNLSLVINDGIKQSKVVIACVTKSYAQSKSCQNELILAVNEYRKPLLVLVLEELKIKDVPEISFYISNLNRCNLYKIEKEECNIWSSKMFREEIIRTLGDHLNKNLYLKESEMSRNNSIEAVANQNNFYSSKFFEVLPLIQIKDWSFIISTPSHEQKKS